MTIATPFWRGRVMHLSIGTALSLALVLGAAMLSARPSWQSMAPGMALVRLSFTHSGARTCRDRTAEELAALPRNMRSAEICERRRAPVRVEMDVDGTTVLAEELPPSGLSGSGPSRIYRRVELPAGSYKLDVRMSDDPTAAGFPLTGTFRVDLQPAQSIAVDFDATRGGFFLH